MNPGPEDIPGPEDRAAPPAEHLDRAIQEAVAALAGCLEAGGLCLTAAESCTGGLVAAALTDRPGSSAWFGESLVTYSNDAKSRLLNVPLALIASQGAVSEAVVAAMVAGALKTSGADLGVAISGVAGPDGGTADKPVGLVCFAWSGHQLPTRTLWRRFAGDRRTVRQQAVLVALEGLREACRQCQEQASK